MMLLDHIETSIIEMARYSRLVSSRASRKRAPDAAPGAVADRGPTPGLLLAVLGHHAMRKLREVHTRYELSPRQFQVLGLLHDRGAMSQRELGEVTEIDPSILVTLLNPLEAEGLVWRERAELDRRRHFVNLTGRGARRLAAAARAQREAEDELFAALDEGQREQLHGLLVALNSGLPGECAAAARAASDCEEGASD